MYLYVEFFSSMQGGLDVPLPTVVVLVRQLINFYYTLKIKKALLVRVIWAILENVNCTRLPIPFRFLALAVQETAWTSTFVTETGLNGLPLLVIKVKKRRKNTAGRSGSTENFCYHKKWLDKRAP